MKRAFTLVELLVVVVVIAILASIVFRLAGLGEGLSKRNITIIRMQRLENAISGYFAAYGSYPPVDLQGRSRNIFYEANGYGIQQIRQGPKKSIKIGGGDEDPGWLQIRAACMAQPVAMEYPPSKDQQSYIKMVAEGLKMKHDMGFGEFAGAEKLGFLFDGLEQPQQLSGKYHQPSWADTQVFKFGLMSYLLPRYILMMGHADNTLYDNFDQWGANNAMPCRFEEGVQYGSWQDLNIDRRQSSERWKIALLPTQTICMRWLPNLEETLTYSFGQCAVYGINLVADGEDNDLNDSKIPRNIYSAGDSQSGTGVSGSQQYALEYISCHDGWGEDLYYYSPPPYQGYRLWSSGENRRTFPPWIPDEEIESNQSLSGYKGLIRNWVADDIVHMSN